MRPIGSVFSSVIVGLLGVSPSLGQTSIEDCVEVIRRNEPTVTFEFGLPKYDFPAKVEPAVECVWNALIANYPSDRFRASTTLEQLKDVLPHKVRDGKPLLVAFSPRFVEADGPLKRENWVWTIQFVEVAGKSANLHYASRFYRDPSGRKWAFPNEGRFRLGEERRFPKGHKYVHVKAFGAASYEWKIRWLYTSVGRDFIVRFFERSSGHHGVQVKTTTTLK